MFRIPMGVLMVAFVCTMGSVHGQTQGQAEAQGQVQSQAQASLNQGVETIQASGATQTRQAAAAPQAKPSTPQGAPDNSAAQTSKKPRKVYTNDDFKEGGEASAYSREPAELVEEANQCDRNCFERAGNEMKIPSLSSAKWKRDLMTAIEEVRSDGPWQSFLILLARMRGRYCQLAGEKQDELSRLPNRQEVSEKEISIDEKYEKKFADANSELILLYQRIGNFTMGDRIRDGFMNFQVHRIMTSNCLVPPPQYPESEPADPDDP